MTATLVATPDTKRGLPGGTAEPTAAGTGAATPANQAIRIVLGRGVVDLVRGQGEEAVSVELTLEFDGLVIKHAVAYPGPSEPAFGYSRVRVENVDVWWRQRLVVPGREPVVTTSIRPRRVVVGRIGRALSAVADYA
ncbi:MAG TPA: hypothetical protein VG034_03215 [Acidimicrobiia bacterium]|nr:hypothetical protein [Acidimicrobiia bacterium]